MLETSPQGLTAHDFHPEAFINPRDVFPSRSRQPTRPGQRAAPSRSPQSLKQLGSPLGLSYCVEQPTDKQSCVKVANDGPDEVDDDSCEGDCDQCEDCFEDHKVCAEDEVQCVDECDECLDEHDKACGQHGQVCTETCDDCDFSCFDCIDWNAFEKDKSLGLSYSVPLLGQNEFGLETTTLSINDIDFDMVNTWPEVPVPPVELAMHHQCLADPMPYWSAMNQAHLCPSNNQIYDPSYAMQTQTQFLPTTYGCHPAAAHRSMNGQQPLPAYDLQSSLATTAPTRTAPARPEPSASQTASPPNPSSNRICQWLMPCGSTCSASFATTADLKKHLKTAHTTPNTTTCRWKTCTATFATLAALTGHISKKHLYSPLLDSDGPFKCTHPSCTKSFMYKQVRDEHIASCHDGNKTFCDVCKQWLNAEGSNFKRHMASHRPKHQHMICKFHHLGCKRRFPRLDNLRRHEACCKWGKKAALHHHHHHRHVAH